MDTADKLRDANPWKAESDPVKLAVLGKLAEELGELTAAVARCIIQGVDGAHPVTGKPNIDWLFEEHIDVENMMYFLRRYVLGCSGTTKGLKEGERADKKCKHIEQWLASF